VLRTFRRGFAFCESDVLPGASIWFAAWHVRKDCGVWFDDIVPGDMVSFDLGFAADGRPQASEVRVLRASALAEV